MTKRKTEVQFRTRYHLFGFAVSVCLPVKRCEYEKHMRGIAENVRGDGHC